MVQSRSRHSPTATNELVPGQKFGDRYEIVEQIGTGSMGVVWQARQTSLNRFVALKMILPSLITEVGLKRFETEAQLAASLNHPGIVPVYDFGEQDGRHYLCMAFVRGATLASRLKGGALSPRDAAQIVRDVAKAVEHAHLRKVIHRDLKPANILLDADHAESPRVTDFGLARRIDAKGGVTAIGQILGTPEYMAPEQAAGQASRVGPPADIYALGAILYHALVGRPPLDFDGEDWLAIIRRICEEPAISPRTIEPAIPEALEAICFDCLAKDANSRLPSAALLAHRLTAFLETMERQTAISTQKGGPAETQFSTVQMVEHVVICGLGELGLRLALEGRRRGKPVVAIERHEESAAIERARSSGVVVIEGDARNEAVLRRARVDQAEFVVAACGDDETNVAVAVLVGRSLPPALECRHPLVCRLLLTDYELRPLLADESLFPVASRVVGAPGHSMYKINFGDLNLHDVAARQCLRTHLLDFIPVRKVDQTVVHLIVIGFGPMGQSLALHAARIGHFANSVGGDLRLRITVVDDPLREEAEIGVKNFQRQFSQMDAICDFRFSAIDSETPALDLVDKLDQLSRDSATPDSLVTYAVCLEKITEPENQSTPAKQQVADNRENFRIGMALARLTINRPVQTLIYQSTCDGFAAILPNEGRGAGVNQRLHAFGMKENIFNWDVLLHESEDRLARAVHMEFQQQRRNEGVPDCKNPDWDQLEEDRKESNRHAADHIPIKLRALGYHNESIRSGIPCIEWFTEAEVVLLAEMEHLRWCAERRLAGWRYGPQKDLTKKEHPCLVPWNELPPQERKKDPEQILAIPRILRTIGQGIYR
jgi:hypothetical protein